MLLWHSSIERNFGVGPSHAGWYSLNLIELCLHVLQLLVDTVPWLRWHWLLLLVAMPPLLSRSIVVCWTANQLLLLRLVRLSDIAHGIFAKGQAAIAHATSRSAHTTSRSAAATATEELILHLLGHHLVLVLLHHLLDECRVQLLLVHHILIHWGLSEGGACC